MQPSTRIQNTSTTAGVRAIFLDLVTKEEQNNGEVNQGNLRVAYDILPVEDMVLNVGYQANIGGIWNRTTSKTGSRYAVALHADWRYRDWNLQLQGVKYHYNPVNPAEVDESTVQFGAFMAPFMVAVDAGVVSFNVAKKININCAIIDNITLYNDFSIVMPTGEDTQNSIQNVTGCLVVKKGLYLYIDWITGQNMWFAGGEGIGLGNEGWDEWKGRLNVNFGYFFSSQGCK